MRISIGYSASPPCVAWRVETVGIAGTTIPSAVRQGQQGDCNGTGPVQPTPRTPNAARRTPDGLVPSCTADNSSCLPLVTPRPGGTHSGWVGGRGRSRQEQRGQPERERLHQ